MEKKTITVQTNTVEKGRLDQRSFSCLYYEGDGVRMYMLDDTRIDLVHKRFNLSAGCRVIDDGVTYYIEEVQYSPRPSRPVLIVDPTIII